MEAVPPFLTDAGFLLAWLGWFAWKLKPPRWYWIP